MLLTDGAYRTSWPPAAAISNLQLFSSSAVSTLWLWILLWMLFSKIITVVGLVILTLSDCKKKRKMLEAIAQSSICSCKLGLCQWIERPWADVCCCCVSCSGPEGLIAVRGRGKRRITSQWNGLWSKLNWN